MFFFVQSMNGAHIDSCLDYWQSCWKSLSRCVSQT